MGIVAPVGADLENFYEVLRRRISQFKYKANSIRLSNFLRNIDLDVELKDSPEAARINTYMTAGNRARELEKQGDILALYAAHDINSARKDKSEPLPRTVHIIRSLKHPDEVRLLRQIYGSGFFLIGVFADEEQRFDIPH